MWPPQSPEETAQINITSQENLLWALREAAHHKGHDVVAERLGLSKAEFEEYLAKGDFTMTELRLLATACGVTIGYKVSRVDRALTRRKFTR